MTLLETIPHPKHFFPPKKWWYYATLYVPFFFFFCLETDHYPNS